MFSILRISEQVKWVLIHLIYVTGIITHSTSTDLSDCTYTCAKSTQPRSVCITEKFPLVSDRLQSTHSLTNYTPIHKLVQCETIYLT